MSHNLAGICNGDSRIFFGGTKGALLLSKVHVINAAQMMAIMFIGVVLGLCWGYIGIL